MYDFFSCVCSALMVHLNTYYYLLSINLFGSISSHVEHNANKFLDFPCFVFYAQKTQTPGSKVSIAYLRKKEGKLLSECCTHNGFVSLLSDFDEVKSNTNATYFYNNNYLKKIFHIWQSRCFFFFLCANKHPQKYDAGFAVFLRNFSAHKYVVAVDTNKVSIFLCFLLPF